MFQNNSQVAMLKGRKVEAKVRGKNHKTKNRFSCFARAVAKCTESRSKSPRSVSNQAT